MIKSIEFIRDLGNGHVVVKDIKLGAPETSGLWVKSIKGIGPGKANINVTDMASSDGGIFNSARAEVRNITLTLGIVEYGEGDNHHTVEDVRRELYKIFGKKRYVDIRIHTDYGVDKDNPEDFVLYTSGYVESCEPEIFNKQETIAISIICPDPNFYNLYGGEVIEFSATESVFEFPINQEISEDDPFIYGQFYYEYDSENEFYFVSEDVTDDGLKQERKDGKNYYVGGLMNETVGSEEQEYIETQDTSFLPGKEYFRVDPNNPSEFIMAPELEMIVDHDPPYEYYEYNNKIIFANITDIVKKDIYYYGEIEVGVIINLRFRDVATGVKVYKVLSDGNQSISLDDQVIEGGGISPGDEITICTIPGQKSAVLVRDAISYNVMNALGRNPIWFLLDYGINTFTYSADSGQEFVDVSISYNPAYEGI